MCALLGGCVTATPTYTPEGKVGQSISCSGTALSWAHCYQKAGETCGAKGYDILDRSAQQGMLGSANGQSAYVGSLMYRTMLIQCRA